MGGEFDGDLIPNDEADGADGLDGGLGSEPGSDGRGITGKNHLNQPESGSYVGNSSCVGVGVGLAEGIGV